MKLGIKGSIFLLVFLLGFGRAGGAGAANCVEIVRDARWTISIDVTSIEDKGAYITAWAKWIPGNEMLEKFRESFGPNYAYQVERRAFSKKSREEQLLDVVACDRNGSAIDEFHAPFSPGSYIPAAPGSYVELTWMKVMEFASTGGKTN